MVRCCDLGGMQYLNDDLTIDRQALGEQGDQLKALVDEQPMDDDYKAVLKTRISVAMQNPCRCPCHLKNNQAIH